MNWLPTGAREYARGSISWAAPRDTKPLISKRPGPIKRDFILAMNSRGVSRTSERPVEGLASKVGNRTWTQSVKGTHQ